LILQANRDLVKQKKLTKKSTKSLLYVRITYFAEIKILNPSLWL